MNNDYINKKVEEWKRKRFQKILDKYDGFISNTNDLLADDEPSIIFYFLADFLRYLLSDDPEDVVSSTGIKVRKAVNPVIKKFGGSFLSCPQVFENRNKLIDPDSDKEDEGIILPKEPVIWAPNHSFKDDILASVLSTSRYSYALIASLPQLYNTLDGLTAWLNGVLMMNRKVKHSRQSIIPKINKTMDLGADVIYFGEGVWNKSPNSLLIHMWPGLYRLAKERGAHVVPVVHYIEDFSMQKSDNLIHTVVDDPVRIDYMPEKEASEFLRDKMATWYYLMMEKYGQSTREELLSGFSDSDSAWEHYLALAVSGVERYDCEIELSADYRPSEIVRPEDVFEPIANIENPTKDNVLHKEYAKQLVKNRKEIDFQRRF